MAQALAHVLAYGKKYGDPWWTRQRPILLDHHAHNQHVAIYGQPGVGKSSAAFSQIFQHIKAHQSFILFEPHGDLQAQVLTALIEQGWQPRDVVIIDPTNRTYGSPIINVLETEAGQELYEVTDEMLAACHAIFYASWGERTADLYRQTFSALGEARLTLSEAPLFLSDTAFRNAVVSQLRNQDVKLFWEKHFAELKPFEQKTYIESPRNKLSGFLSSPYLNPVFSGSTSTIRFAEIMNQGKACLVNLSQNHLKESRKLFGALLLSKLSLAILSRESLPADQRSPVTIICDEAPEYFVQSCLLIAASSRKFGVSFRILAQSPSQFKEEDVDILFATLGTHIVFSVDRKSAERLAKEIWTFSGKRIKYVDRDFWGPKGYPQYYSVQEELEHAITELTTQGMAECYIRIKGPGQDERPYIATIPPVTFPIPDPEKEEAFRQASAARYYTPLATIEEERKQRLAHFTSPQKATKPFVTEE